MAVMISIFRWFWIGTLLTSMVGGFFTQHGTAVSRGLSMSRGFSSTPPSRGRSETSPRGKSGFEKSQGSSKRSGPSSRAGRSVETGYDKKRSSTSGKREEQVNDDIKLESSERIQKLIARSGIASRRDAEKMILEGRVTVNGKMTKELGTKVDIRKDKVVVNGKQVTMPDNKGIFWVALNKPKDCLSTLDDDKGRTTIRSLIPKASDLRLVTVGRMDRDNTGLLLLTNEVGWIHPLTHPSYSISKRYELVVEGFVSDAAIKAANEGSVFPLTNRQFPRCTLEVLDVDKLNRLTLLEFQANDYTSTLMEELIESMQCKLVSSRRTGFGPLRLKGLKKGEWRELSPAEIVKLKAACKKLPNSVIETAKIVGQERAKDRAEKQLQRELKYNPGRIVPETGRRIYRPGGNRGFTPVPGRKISSTSNISRDHRDRGSGSGNVDAYRNINRPRGSPFVSETSREASMSKSTDDSNSRTRSPSQLNSQQRSSRVLRVNRRGSRDDSEPPIFDERQQGRNDGSRKSSNHVIS